MKRFVWAVFAAALALGFAGVARAGVCDDPGQVHQSAPINIGAATTTAMVSPTATQRIYVCSIAASLAGTTPTITIKYGTRVSTDCDTGAISLSGALAPLTGAFLVLGYGSDLFQVPVGNQVCGTTAGTGSSFQGIISYVAK